MTIKGMAAGCLLALCTLPVAAQKQQFALDKCIEMALKNNTEVKNARLEVEVADEDRKYAFTQIFPQISAMGAGFVGAKDLMRGQMEVPQMGAMPLSMIKKGVVATLTALQPLYMGGQIINANKMAELQREVRHLEFEMTEKDVIQNVHDYYWQLVALRGNIATLEAAEKQLNEVYGLTKKFVDAGVTTRNDLLRVELKKQETASQRLKLDNGIELLDMPGVLWPKFEDKSVGERLAYTGAVKDTVYDLEWVAMRFLTFLRDKYPHFLEQRYKVSPKEAEDLEPFDLLELVGRKRGMLVSGGEVNTERAAITVMDEFRSGKIGRITLERPRSASEKAEVEL